MSLKQTTQQEPSLVKEVSSRKRVELSDFYGELGCCLVCNEIMKDYAEGLERDVYLNGKYYSCLCFEGKCTSCSWYGNRECQRKFHDELNFEIAEEVMEDAR